ncbi:MAG: hypothetical protein OXD46_09620 [Chloroflexi bacterium]|nr:hypothetical protein [Chloroflexota bacterium]
MLLVGIPIAEYTFWWLLPHILGNFNITFDIWSLPPFLRPFLNVSLILLALFYFQVRRMGRTILPLLWAFVFVSEAVNIVASPFTYLSDPGQIFELSESWWVRWEVSVGLWSINAASLQSIFLTTLVLVWFARQASKISFGHALVLIGLATPGYAYQMNVPGMIVQSSVFLWFENRVIFWDLAAFALVVTLFAVWVLSRLEVSREKHQADIERRIRNLNIPAFSAALGRLAIRVLPRFDPARGISKDLLLALYGSYWILSIYVTLRFSIAPDFDIAILVKYHLVALLMSSLLSIAIPILLAYAVRVDVPTEDPATIEP